MGMCAARGALRQIPTRPTGAVFLRLSRAWPAASGRTISSRLISTVLIVHWQVAAVEKYMQLNPAPR